MLSYGNAQYIYSKNGELQKKIVGADTTNYVYDYFGNLLSVRLPRHGGQADGDFIEYIIDGQNRRVGKKINGQIVKRWIYSGQLSPIAELDSAGNVIAQFIGNEMIKNGTTYQLVTDHLGSVRLVVDINTGDVAQKMDYDEFGNLTYDSNPGFQPFGYSYGLYDMQTKLVRFGARDYDASFGRWTCKDPIAFGGGQSNLFVYVSNDPIQFTDVAGLGRGGYRPLALVDLKYTYPIKITSAGVSVYGIPIINSPLYDYTIPLELVDLRAAHAAYITDNGDIYGFFGEKGGVINYKIDPYWKASDYQQFGEKFDDTKMLNIIYDNVWEQQFLDQYKLYGPLTNNSFNCQQWLDALIAEYKRRYCP